MATMHCYTVSYVTMTREKTNREVSRLGFKHGIVVLDYVYENKWDSPYFIFSCRVVGPNEDNIVRWLDELEAVAGQLVNIEKCILR
jgi:hypothetical protein